MISLSPIPYNDFTCPKCTEKGPLINEILFPGMFIIADCTCHKCGYTFFTPLPVSHHVNYCQSLGKSTKDFYGEDETSNWLSDLFIDLFDHVIDDNVPIQKRVLEQRDSVIILNTLDYIYGHVLLKLYNASHHLKEDKGLGLILIIPKSFEWLIPEGCAEIWIVDLPLSAFKNWYKAIDRFVKNQLDRFKNVYLSRAYSHPKFESIDIKQFTNVVPFDIDQFDIKPQTVTFIVREDRWWLKNRLDNFFYLVCRKFKLLKWGGRRLAKHQNRLIKQTIRHIRLRHPDVHFYVVGFGQTGNLKGYVNDYRSVNVDQAKEIEWCKIYAASHVVVGVHGSNMLLPTAHAASCVEILPTDRMSNFLQDISVRYSGRKSLFLYQFLDQFSTPKQVANRVLGILNHFPSFKKNMCDNIYAGDEASLSDQHSA
jgi:hypothetical protein